MTQDIDVPIPKKRAAPDQGKSLRKLSELKTKRIKRSDTLTTGMVADLCRVAARTVSKWCDNGFLPCYRLPGCSDRRINKSDLIKFMKDNGMPLNELEEESPRLLCFSSRSIMSGLIEEDLGGWKVGRESNVALFTIEMVTVLPKVILLDYNLGKPDCQSILWAVDKLVYKPIVLAIAEDRLEWEVPPQGCHSIYFWPGDRIKLNKAIRECYQR